MSDLKTISRRPKTLWLLFLFFCWVEGRALLWLLFPAFSGSYHFHAARDQVWVHYAGNIVTVAITSIATSYLWRPKPGWSKASLAALAVFAAETLVSVWYTVNHLDTMRDAYALGRAERGVPMSPDRLAQIITPQSLWATALLITAFYLVLGIMVWRRRGYLPPDEHYMTVAASAS